MKRVGASLAFVLACLSAIAVVRADPNKVEYELQEGCGKTVAAWFNAEYGRGINEREHSITGFESHHNRMLNKCLVMVSYGITESKSENRSGLVQVHLFDLNEGKSYGEYFAIPSQPPTECRVDKKPCRSEEEWHALAKPFMEE